MKINFTVPFRRVLPMRTLSVAPTEPQGRAARIARLLALAHKLDSMVGSGEIRDYAQLARLGHISPARLTQIMVLLHLPDEEQEGNRDADDEGACCQTKGQGRVAEGGDGPTGGLR